MIGDTILLQPGARVRDLIENALINHQAAVLGVDVKGATLPLFTLPAVNPVTPGAQDIVVGSNRSMNIGPGAVQVAS